jgi:hypothetical protein
MILKIVGFYYADQVSVGYTTVVYSKLQQASKEGRLSTYQNKNEGDGWAIAHSAFVISVNPTLTRGSKLCPPHYYGSQRIFRPSYGPAKRRVSSHLHQSKLTQQPYSHRRKTHATPPCAACRGSAPRAMVALRGSKREYAVVACRSSAPSKHALFAERHQR